MNDAGLLSTELSPQGAMLVLTCTGCAEAEAFLALAATLDRVHADAMKQGIRIVIADLRGLEFASSACLKAFVTWLHHVQDLDDEHRYKVRFLSNPLHSWQRRSLGALAVFAAGVVEIEAGGS